MDVSGFNVDVIKGPFFLGLFEWVFPHLGSPRTIAYM